MNFHYYMFILLIIASIFLIGGGITGKVVSESCCFPPNCAEENICDAAKLQYLESPSGVPEKNEGVFLSVLGFFVLVGTIFLLYVQHRIKHKNDNPKKQRT